MKRFTSPARAARAFLLLAVTRAVLGASPAAAQALSPSDALVESVDVVRNQFVQKATLLFYVSTKPGDRYDEARVKDDFRRLWETGFLEDLTVDVSDTPRGGKRITFAVAERKRVQIVDFRGSKDLSNTAIEEELKKREATIRVDSFYDPGKARRVEHILRDMLKEKGRPFATVKHDPKTVGGAGLQLVFNIDDGPKARVDEITFVGNSIYDDATLRRRMKSVMQPGLVNLSWLKGKTKYTEEKWQEDKERLLDWYLDHGYVTAEIGEPKITYVDLKTGKKPKKGVRLEIPVTEGAQYRVGEVKFEGLTVFKEEGIRPLFKLETGEVYSEKRIKKAYEKLRDAYGSQGYFQWTGYTKRNPDPARKVVDVTLSMEEDKQYFVGQIRFTGNETTRDKVIRREIYLNEGEVFNTEALKLSIRRINQLGYFKPIEGAPELAPNKTAPDRIDVTFKVDEQNRNQFTFGGGVSGLEGTFVNASFSTSNFLGMGETFQVSAQSGARTKNYQIAVTEPYLFDRPITAGFDLFKRRLRYDSFANVVGFTQDTAGLSLVTGIPLGRFTRLFGSYAFEIIDIQQLEAAEGVTDPTATTPLLDPFYYGTEGKRRESRFAPTFVHNTVDSPFTPRSGVKLTATVPLTGGPLGGTVNYYRPSLEAVVYVPHFRKTALGLRAEVAYVQPFGDTKTLSVYQRLYLGGETQIRGYNIRSVGPLDLEKNQALGGNKSVLFNAEYYFDVGGPLRALLFFDAGQAYLEGQRIDLKQLRTSTGAELRFIMPVLNVPFRLIYAFNPHRDKFQPKSAFKFAVGTTF